MPWPGSASSTSARAAGRSGSSSRAPSLRRPAVPIRRRKGCRSSSRRSTGAPAETAGRGGRGTDNGPLAWGDDARLYTAYGDGNGFEPFVPEKLSLGLATISGPPEAFTGENLRSPTAEQKGDGPKGKKASG